MLLLQTNNVKRQFGADVLFHNINLQVQTSDRIGLVGRNGAGKTTLLKIIAQLTTPDDGTVSLKKGATLGYLAQDQGLDSQNNIWAEMDSVFSGLHAQEQQIHKLEQKITTLDPATPDYEKTLTLYDQLQHDFDMAGGFQIETNIRGVLHGFHFENVDYETPINSLSGGQKTQLALAKLLLQRPDVLILDEPTNHLDMATLSWLEDYLKSYSGALLLVSHDRYFLDHVITQVYDLDHHELTHYTGNYSAFVDQKAHNLIVAQKHYDQQQAKINELEDFVNKNIVRASTTKRAQARRKQLEKMERLERPVTDDRQSMHFSFHAQHSSGEIVLQVNHAVIGYDQEKIAGPITFEVRKPRRYAIIGANGVGKSTLLKSILHQIDFIQGDMKLGTNVTIGYYDQEQQLLHPNKTVLDEIWDDHPTVDEKEIRSLLGSFLFIGEDVFKPVHALSGGEKARLLLTKLTFEEANFLILDEPTNHLDIDSREILEQALNDFEGTVLFISHDRYFINQVATDILALTKTEMTHYKGDYDIYLEQLEKQATSAVTSVTATTKTVPTNQDYQQQKETQKKQRKLQRQVDELETQLDDLENQKAQLELTMATPEVYSDAKKSADAQAQMIAITEKIAACESNWTQLEEELENFS